MDTMRVLRDDIHDVNAKTQQVLGEPGVCDHVIFVIGVAVGELSGKTYKNTAIVFTYEYTSAPLAVMVPSLTAKGYLQTRQSADKRHRGQELHVHGHDFEGLLFACFLIVFQRSARATTAPMSMITKETLSSTISKPNDSDLPSWFFLPPPMYPVDRLSHRLAVMPLAAQRQVFGSDEMRGGSATTGRCSVQDLELKTRI